MVCLLNLFSYEGSVFLCEAICTMYTAYNLNMHKVLRTDAHSVAHIACFFFNPPLDVCDLPPGLGHPAAKRMEQFTRSHGRRSSERRGLRNPDFRARQNLNCRNWETEAWRSKCRQPFSPTSPIKGGISVPSRAKSPCFEKKFNHIHNPFREKLWGNS